MVWSLLACTPPSEDTAPGTPFDEQVDVVVVGAGPAGMAAVIEAAAAGATVVLLEREATAGNAGTDEHTLMFFAGSEEQAAIGVEDSPERLAAEWSAFTGGDPADPWFQRFADEHVERVHDWLAGFGMRWDAPGADEGTGGVERAHGTASGSVGLRATLEQELPANVLRVSTEATELVVEDGRVTGVRWAATDGTDEGSIGADATIVATGGFLWDVERVKAALPEVADVDIRSGSWPGADGNGLDKLVALGAATQNLGGVGFYAHGVPRPEDPVGEVPTGLLVFYPCIGGDGRRFYDESQMNSFVFGRERARVIGGEAWLIANRQAEKEQFRLPDGDDTVYTLDDLLAAGIAIQADSAEALADAVGVDRATLQGELAAWNAGVRGEAPDPWRETPSGRLLDQGPFFAIQIAAAAAKAFGGVDVDIQGRVLHTDGSVIPGVYAAGELTGMLGGSLVGIYGFTGSLTAVVLGGRVAGENAAAEGGP